MKTPSFASSGAASRGNPAAFRVTFSFGSEERYAELMENISLEGAFIRTDAYFFPGEEVTVSIPFASRKRQVRVRGKVVRHNAQGIGIKFEKRPGSPTKAR